MSDFWIQVLRFRPGVCFFFVFFVLEDTNNKMSGPKERRSA